MAGGLHADEGFTYRMQNVSNVGHFLQLSFLI